MAISSTGIGSGLDVNSIVSQLVAIEKQPLQTLQVKATNLQSRLSLYGTIKSQVAALNDAATAIAKSDKWSIQKATSSNAAAVSVSAGATATPTSFSLDISRLAQAQTTSSRSVAVGTKLGAGSSSGQLTIQLGSWGATGAGPFVPGASSVSVPVNESDTYSDIATRINGLNTGVKATVLRSGGVERLSFQSTGTGQAAGFTVASDAAFADSLSFTSLANPLDSLLGMQSNQSGLDAQVKINGIALEAATNTLTDVVPGLTLKLAQTTAALSPAQVTVEQDQETIQKNLQALADAYSALNKTLADSTRYVPAGRSGVLQGDSTTTGIQSVMRSIVGSASAGAGSFSRLSNAGLEIQPDGSMKLDSAKLTEAFKSPDSLQKLFVLDNANNATNGFGLKLRDFAKGLIAADGRVTNKSNALQGEISRNSDDQDRVNARASRVEKQLRAQYSALDTQVARMSSLSSYVTAQLAQWNRSS